MDACTRLAAALVSGPADQQGWARAVTLWERGCEMDRPGDCLGLVIALVGGEGVAKDENRAGMLAEKTCGQAPDRCQLLARAYLDREVPDEPKARRFLERGCAGKSALACANLGELKLKGAGDARDILGAAELMERAHGLWTRDCAAGRGASCRELGLTYRVGTTGVRDAARGDELLAQGCAAADGQACIYAAGADTGAASDDRRARGEALIQKECDAGEFLSCVFIDSYRRGRQVAEESNQKARRVAAGEAPPAAVSAKQSRFQDPLLTMSAQVCDAGVGMACYRLAQALRDGQGVERDPAAAAVLLEKSCTLDVPGACFDLGQPSANAPGLPDAVARLGALEKACRLRMGKGCTQAAALRLAGEGAPRDAEAALALYRAGCELKDRDACRGACDAGDAATCTALGDHYAHPNSETPDLPQSFTLFQRACDRNDVAGCVRLARAYADGIGVAIDPSRAIAVLEKSCGRSEPRACSALGNHLMQQASPDRARALRLYRGACDAGWLWGCIEAGLLYSDGSDPEPEAAKAVALFAAACRGGNAEGCQLWGEYHSEVETSGPSPRTLFRAACLGGIPEACRDIETVP